MPILLLVKVVAVGSRLSCGKPCLLRGRGIKPRVYFSVSLRSSVPGYDSALEISGTYDVCGKPFVPNDSRKN